MKNFMLALVVAFGMTSVYAAEPAKTTKEAPKAEQKKAPAKPVAEKKKETPPAPKVAPEIKKPEKKRDAPKDVQKKAAEENAKK